MNKKHERIIEKTAVSNKPMVRLFQSKGQLRKYILKNEDFFELYLVHMVINLQELNLS